MIFMALVVILSTVVYGVLREIEIRFPANIEIELGETTLEAVKIYYATKGEWSERNSSQAKITESQKKVEFSLPLTVITHYRIDPDAGKHSMVIRRLCFSSRLSERCWGAAELNEKFVPFNGVSHHELTADGLRIETEGSDPYFSFAGDDRLNHDAVARLNRWIRLVISLVVGGLVTVCFWWLKFKGLTILSKRFYQCRDQGFAMTTADVAASVSLFAMFVSLAWVGIDTLGKVVWTLVLGAMIMMRLLGNQIMVHPFRRTRQPSDRRMSLSRVSASTLFALVLLLPSGWSLVASWSGEFPNVGDHEYLSWVNSYIYEYLRYEWWLLLGLPIGIVVSVLFRKAWAYSVVAMLVLIAYSFYMDVSEPIYRYPSAARIVALPYIHLALGEWFSVFDAGRLSNFMALIAWLGVLRPWLLGRWPDWKILPFALAFCLQGEMAYFFSSVYLEAWSLVLIALAMELQLSKDDQNASLKACLLLGLAAVFKEPAVFLIPWFWLAGRPWAKGIDYFRQSIVVGLGSVLPFLLYYAVRREFGISRFKSDGFDYFLSEAWWLEMSYRMQFHLGETGIAMLFLIVLLLVYLLVRSRPGVDRWALLCVVFSALSLFTMFNIDFSSKTYTGYFRFYLPIYVLLLAPLLLVPKLDKKNAKNHGIIPGYWFMAAVFVVLVGNGPRLFSYIKLFSYPDAARNFTEHYDAPIYLPIRDLIEQAESQGALRLDTKTEIHVNFVTNWNQPPQGYPDLMKKYTLNVDADQLCACSQEVVAIVAPYVYYTGLNKRLRDPDFDGITQLSRDHFRRWQQDLSGRSQCLATLKNTCDFYAEQVIQGEVVGAIGIMKHPN